MEGLEKLQRLQNRCLKICKGFNMRHGTRDLHFITKIPMLEARRIAHINNFMQARTARIHLMDNRDIRTRAHDAPLFSVNIPNVEAYKRSVEYAGSVRWNNLDKELRGIKDSKVFKAKQKSLMLKTTDRE